MWVLGAENGIVDIKNSNHTENFSKVSHALETEVQLNGGSFWTQPTKIVYFLMFLLIIFGALYIEQFIG